MTTMVKPKYCGQNWLDMKPTNGGRICGQCHKTIVDFTKIKWSEIERIQQANHSSVCGMYSQKQLDYWGQEIPKKNCSNAIATTALLFSLTTTQSFSQTTPTNTDTISRTIIRGIVTGKTQEGIIDTLPFTSIYLKNTKIGVTADIDGKYQLDITNYIDTLADPSIIFAFVGFDNLELKLKNDNKGELNYNAQLNQGNVETTYFYVTENSFKQRVKWRLKKWFGRKHEK